MAKEKEEIGLIRELNIIRQRLDDIEAMLKEIKQMLLIEHRF